MTTDHRGSTEPPGVDGGGADPGARDGQPSGVPLHLGGGWYIHFNGEF
jgi:hypothetical protein